MAGFNRERIRETFQGIKRDVRAAAPQAVQFVKAPKFLEARAEGVERIGQVLALMFLPIFILVNLIVVQVINNLMASAFGAGDWSSSGDAVNVIGWLITFVTLLLVMLSGWIWFQFVRTAAFGFFKW